jgi:peptide/nickel transport system substrate-binding protein
MMFPVWRLLLACLLLALVQGCSSKKVDAPPMKVIPLGPNADVSHAPLGKAGGILVFSSSNEPSTFNPLIAEDKYSSDALDLMLKGLVEFDWVKQKIVPGLTESWDIAPDQKTYTFHLRHDVHWSDGEPFTADDVIFTFDAIFDSRYTNRYSQQYVIGGKRIEYKKIDDYTVQFQTAEIYAPFLNDIGFAAILPKHKLKPFFDDGSLQKQWSVDTASNHPADIVGTGPYVLESFETGERMVFRRNPNYWRQDQAGTRLPYIDKVIMKFVQDVNTEVLLFATGQTDISGIRGTDIPWIRKAATLYNFHIVERGPANQVSFLWFNLNPGKDKKGKPFIAPYKLKWFQDKRFRQAVLYGFDRQGLVDAILRGRGAVITSIIPLSRDKWYNPNVKTYPYDPAKAARMLAEIGFKKQPGGQLVDAAGHPVEFELLATEGGSLGNAMDTSFKENMKELGITVKLTYVDFATLQARTNDSFDYEASGMGFGGGNAEPSGMKALFESSGRFHVWYPEQKTPATEWEARVDKLFDAQMKILDESKRVEIIHQIQDIYGEEVPLLFLVVPNAYAGIKNRIKNIEVPPIGTVYWNIDELWLEPEP